MDSKDLIRLKVDVVDAIRSRMKKSGAIESYYNKITGGTGACENVPTAFILKNTKELSFLSQTDQLLMETEVLDYGFDAIWTLGRSFRNEPRAGDGRHLSEFALLEYECRDMSLNGLLKFQQQVLDESMKVAIESQSITSSHKREISNCLSSPASQITYTAIVDELRGDGYPIEWGDDFDSIIEKHVCIMHGGPVQITHYPESIKFFNMYRSDRSSVLKPNLSINEYNEARYTVDCVDFILPQSGETFGGSRREEDYETLSLKLKESRMFEQMAQIRADETANGVVTSNIQNKALLPFMPYLNLFDPTRHSDRAGVKRSGFGLGMGRLIQFLIGSSEVVVF